MNGGAGPVDEAPSEAASTDESRSLRVMTFNIRVNVEADGPDAWPYRKDYVTDLIRFHRPDIVGVQEALPEQLSYLREELPGYEWLGVGRLGDGEGEAVPVGFRTDRFREEGHGTFWLSEAPEEPGSQSWDAAHPRIATWVRIVDEKTNTPLTVFNTHFDHESELARKRSAELVLRQLGELAREGPTLLMGDFNCTEGSEPYRILTGDVGELEGDAADVQTALDGGLMDTQHASEEGHYGPEATIHRFTGEAERKIDFVFASPDVKVLRHAVLTDQEVERYPSDHFPVLTDLRLSTEE